MKRLSMLGVVIGGMCLGACSDDDKDFQLNVDQLTQKDWYYNGYRGEKYSYSSTDVLEVTRFENGNKRLIGVEFSGRRDTVTGTWRASENTIYINRGNTDEKWDILKCNADKLVVNNGWGDRTYYRELSYLDQLAGDAFWINDYAGDHGDSGMRTNLAYRLQGNKNIREAYALLSDTEKVELKRSGNIWLGMSDKINEGEPRRVRFYCRVGANNYVKFDEQVYGDNLPKIPLSDFNFAPVWPSGSASLHVSWKAINRPDVYYKIEVYEEKDAENPYFVSLLLPANTKMMEISRNTNGSINRMDDLQAGKTYRVRLTVMLFEPGIHYNDKNAESNLQAVSYVTNGFVR